MDSVDKLLELYRFLQDGLIKSKNCKHKDFSNPKFFCETCFILNLIFHASETEKEFIEETSDEQRRVIDELFKKYSEHENTDAS